MKIRAPAKSHSTLLYKPAKKTKKYILGIWVEIKMNLKVSSPAMLMTPKQVKQPLLDFFLTATIIIKTTIGSGIISLPYTISTLGYVFALILFAVFFCLNQFSSVLLLKSKNLSKHSNYSTILNYIWPSDGSRIFGSALIFVDNLGTCKLLWI